MQPITVVIADLDGPRREACGRLLRPESGIRIVGETRSRFETVAVIARLRPRILLLDWHLSWMDGLTLLPILRQKSPWTRVILLTRRVSQARLLEALAHGALGYLERSALPAHLARAIRAVDGGEAWIPRKMVARLVNHLVGLTAQRPRRVGQGSMEPRSNRLRLVTP